MDNLNAVVEFLDSKLSKIALNSNKRQNQGALIVKNIVEQSNNERILHHIASQAIHIVAQQCQQNRNNGLPKGKALLTNSLANIGHNVVLSCGYSLDDPYDRFHVGSFLLSALYCGNKLFVDIQQELVGNSSRPAYVITIQESFIELVEEVAKEGLILSYTTTEMIPDITSVQQTTHTGSVFSVVKGALDDLHKTNTANHALEYQHSILEGDTWVVALNKLQQQGWKVNTDVLDIIEKEWDNIVPKNIKNPFVGENRKAKLDEADAKYSRNPSKKNKDTLNNAARLWQEELVYLQDISKYVSVTTIKKKAEALRDAPEFYQYADVDYRGRVYYKEAFFNFQGTDMARGLFMFSEGTTLTSEGLRWLAIHCAQSYNETYHISEIPEWCQYDYTSYLKERGLETISVDKMTMQDREIWTFENFYKIMEDSWKIVDCEKPFMYLAAAIELRKWHNDPYNYVCHLPVAIDGTCNGYQHSGAIARDELTGAYVALKDSDIPEDLYVKAAQQLMELEEEFFAQRPKMTMKHIRKYIAKRGTMTRAYSAGAKRIAENMYEDCRKDEIDIKFNIEMTDCLQLANSLIEALSIVCPGATKTMNWLQELAKFELGRFESYDIDGQVVKPQLKKKLHAIKQDIIKKKKKGEATIDDELTLQFTNERLQHIKDSRTLVYGNGSECLSWVSPSSFPVYYYSYYLNTDCNIMLSFMDVPIGQKKGDTYNGRVNLKVAVPSNSPRLNDFQAGISPNYIHSYDAAHMSYVIESWDGVFGAIHDSYSTHPNDVGLLQELTRECFVEMYDSDDVFEDIKENILSNTDGFVIDKPEYGILDIKETLKSKYFFC